MEIVNKGLRAIQLDGDYYVREDGVFMRKYRSKDGYKEMVGSPQTNGYLKVHTVSGAMYIHRLVANAFVPNPDNLPTVDHINGDKRDNRAINLRWCTIAENSWHYRTKLNAADKKEFMKSAHEGYLEMQSKVMELADANTALHKELVEANCKIELLNAQIHSTTSALLQDKLAFEGYKKNEMAKIATINSNYKGYKSTSGNTFTTVQAMVQATGKSIVVDGMHFIAAGTAASYICDKEEVIGASRNHATISKELRRYLQGKRSQWVMYGKYTIGY